MAAGFKTATVTSGDVPSTQTNFPAYVDLSRLGITTLAEAQSVRVYAESSKTTEWAREIVSATEMHVKIPSLTNTTSIYVDWDGSSADYAITDTYGAEAVWTDFEGVYHFETSSVDSSDNSRDGTDTSITYGTGKIGGCAYNTSKAGKISTGSWSLTSAFSVGFWIKYDGLADLQTAFSTADGSTGSAVGNAYTYLFPNTEGGYSNFSVDSGWVDLNQVTGTWYHFYYTHNGTTVTIYFNGASVDTGNVSHTTATKTFAWMARPDIGTQSLDGYIDEGKIRNSQLSANWVLTEYNNQSDEAGFWGTWTDAGGGGGGSPTPTLMMLGVGT